MGFQISGLDYAEFSPLFGMTDEQLRQRNIVRRVADTRPGFPCRVSLRDAQPGEMFVVQQQQRLARLRHPIVRDMPFMFARMRNVRSWG